MANKLSIPSVSTLGDKNMSYGTIVFLQSIEDALKTVDSNVLYKDAVSTPITVPIPRAVSAQGQGFSISGVNVASGKDFGVLVSDTRAILQGLTALSQKVDNLYKEIRGK